MDGWRRAERPQEESSRSLSRTPLSSGPHSARSIQTPAHHQASKGLQEGDPVCTQLIPFKCAFSRNKAAITSTMHFWMIYTLLVMPHRHQSGGGKKSQRKTLKFRRDLRVSFTLNARKCQRLQGGKFLAFERLQFQPQELLVHIDKCSDTDLGDV